MHAGVVLVEVRARRAGVVEAAVQVGMATNDGPGLHTEVAALRVDVEKFSHPRPRIDLKESDGSCVDHLAIVGVSAVGGARACLRFETVRRTRDLREHCR